MAEEEEIKDIFGEVQGWAKDVRDFKKGGRGCRGIKVNDEWHNLIGLISELKEMDQKFPNGTTVSFKEKKNNRGYWDIEGDIRIDDPKKEQVKLDGTEKDFKPQVDPNVWVEKDKNIQMHVAFKAAIEEMKTVYSKSEGAIDMNEFAKLTLEFTERYYKGLKKVKSNLQEKGEW